jgi:CspA family cold shock protein
MKTGKVKFFNKAFGYGFIIADETKQQVYMHKSNMQQKVKRGDEVIFALTEDHKGPKAIEVRLKE